MLLGLAAALVIGGYLYLWLDDEILRQVRHRLSSHYPDLHVKVGSARFEQDRGIAIGGITVTGSKDASGSQPLIAIQEMYLAGKIRMEELISGQPNVERIIIRRARLHAVRHSDGEWSLAALLPLPRFSEHRPEVRIENTTVVLEGAFPTSTSSLLLQDVNLTLTPIERSGGDEALPRYRIAGTVKGLPARELRCEGEVGVEDGALNVAITASGLEVSRELLTSLPGIERLLPIDADASARTDVQVQVTRRGAAAGWEWSGTIKINHGRLVHPLLPEPLSDVEVNVQMDSSRLFIERLTGRLGSANITLACERAGWAAKAPLAVAAKVVGLPINERFKAALPESLARVWQRFQPEGTVDLNLRATFDGNAWRPELSADCRGISLTDAEKFPYRLEQTQGSVQYTPAGGTEPDRLHLDLVAIGGGQPVRIRADFTQVAPTGGQGEAVASGLAGPLDINPPRPQSAGYRGNVGRPPRRKRHPVGWVEISGSSIPLHEQLVTALPEKAESLVRSLRPQGAIDFQFRAEWTDPFQPRADVTHRIELNECAIQYAPFPYPLHRVQGVVTARNGQWTLHDIEARGADETTLVTCRGTSTPIPAGCHVDLLFTANNVALDDSLKRALQPPAQRAWNELQPQGRVDFAARVIHQTGQPKPTVAITAEPRDRTLSIQPLKFPYRFEQVQGVARLEAGRVELANLRARHDRAEYSAAAGTWQPRADGGWQLELRGLNADRFMPYGDRDLLVALPPALQSIVERLQPTGTFNIVNSSLSLAQSPQFERLAASWDVNVDCHQAAMQGGLPLDSVSGGIHLVGRSDNQTFHTFGELQLDSLTWKDTQFTNVRGPLWIDRLACLFGEPASAKIAARARRITADSYGGSLTLNAEVQHAVNPRYTLDLAVGGLSLARFANERIGGPSELSGTVAGRLLLAGTGRSLPSLNGRGELHVVDANIYELPVLVRLLKVLSNRAPTTTAFNRCDMQFTIRGEHVNFQNLNLQGDAFSLYGEGETNFDRELDLVFYTLIGPADLPIPLLRSIAGQVSQQGLQLKVVGNWDDPDVQQRAFPAVNDMIERIQAGAATMSPATAVRDTFGVQR